MSKPSQHVLAFLESLEKENPEEFKNDEKSLKRKWLRDKEEEIDQLEKLSKEGMEGYKETVYLQSRHSQDPTLAEVEYERDETVGEDDVN